MNHKVTNWGIGIFGANRQASKYPYHQINMRLPSRFRLKASALLVGAVLSSLFISSGSVQANPNISDATVVGNVEAVTFDQPNASTLNINTTDLNGTIIDWNAFSIGAGETTNFNQVSADSAVLNRVTGANISDIQGQLNSNGQVFLVNPNGIVFGQNAVVDTAGLVASTLNITNDDFSQNRLIFEGSTTSRIENNGQLQVTNGDGSITLIAPDIQNNGFISTKSGSIGLVAGSGAVEIFPATSNVSFQLNSTGLANGTLENVGDLATENGAISAFANQLTQKGTIQANQVVADANGEIRLVAQNILDIQSDSNITSGFSANTNSGNISLESAGTLNVGGQVKSLGQNGGSINITGAEITISGVVDASGTTGGGFIGIGNDFVSASDPSLEEIVISPSEFIFPVTSLLAVEVGSSITANADIGQGGSINLSSIGNTNIAGQVSSLGENGGNIFVTGNEITLAGSLNVSGVTGGGFVSVGKTFSSEFPSNTTSIESGVEGDVSEFPMLGISNLDIQIGSRITANGNNQGGSINLNSNGSNNVAGQVSSVGQIGGNLSISGAEITLAETGILDVSGTEEGGSLNIGNQVANTSSDPLSSEISSPVTSRLDVKVGSMITASASGNGQGGNIHLRSVGDTIIAGQVDSALGGDINISGKDIIVSGIVSAIGSSNTGNNGAIKIGESFLTTESPLQNITISGTLDVSDVNNAGFINIGSVSLNDPFITNISLTDNSIIKANASSLQGQGGSINVFGNGGTTVDGQLTATAQIGTGGNIQVIGNQTTVAGTVDTSGADQGGFIGIQSRINTNVSGNLSSASGGHIDIFSDKQVAVSGTVTTLGSSNQGQGGFIHLYFSASDTPQTVRDITVLGTLDVSGVDQGGFINIGDFFRDDFSDSTLPLQGTSNITIADSAIIKSNADGTQGQAGIIEIEGNGAINVAGELSAVAQIGTGGKVRIQSEGGQVTVSRTIDASGNTAGGEIDIGELDFDDKTSPRNTKNTTITSTATLKADGLENGKGGLIFVGGLESVRIDGVLSVKGGSVSGDGGLIGTAGLGSLVVNTAPNASAINGKTGSWVLVSDALTIDADKATTISAALNTGTNVSLIGLGTGTEAELDAIILARTGVDVSDDDGSNAALSSADDLLKVASSGEIEIDAAITKTNGGDASLSLDAQKTIAVNADITATSGKLNVALETKAAGDSGTVTVNNAIKSNGGAIDLKSNTNVNVVGQLNSAVQTEIGGNISIAANQINVSGTIDASGDIQGGLINIGGDAGSSLHATNITITESANIKSDASAQGRGGSIEIQSIDSINISGVVSSTGGFIRTRTDGQTTISGALSVFSSNTNGFGGRIDMGNSFLSPSNVKNITISGTIDASAVNQAGSIVIGNVSLATQQGTNIVLTETARIKADASAQQGRAGFIAIADNISSSTEPTVAGSLDIQSGSLISASATNGQRGFIQLQSRGNVDVAGQVNATSSELVEISDTDTQIGTGQNIFVSGEQVVVSGGIDASGVEQGGNVEIEAKDTVNISGQISAVAQLGTGGDIEIESDSQVTVSGTIDASGNTQGGDISIGELDFDDRTALRNTNDTILTSTATIKTDGLEKGNGGEIFIGGLDSVNIEGVLSAQGGSVSGNGGLIATVGLGSLVVNTAPNASASNGNSGYWVLVSDALTIDSNKATTISAALNTGTNVSLIGLGTGTKDQLEVIVKERTGFDVSDDDGDGTTTAAQTVSNGRVEVDVAITKSSGGDASLAAKTASSGGIEVDAAITKSSGGDASLSLDANESIVVNAPISSTSGKLEVALSTITGGSDGVVLNANIDTNGGSLNVPAGVVNPELEPETTNDVDEAIENSTNTITSNTENADDINDTDKSENTRDINKTNENEDDEDDEKDKDELKSEKEGNKEKDKDTNLPSSIKQC